MIDNPLPRWPSDYGLFITLKLGVERNLSFDDDGYLQCFIVNGEMEVSDVAYGGSCIDCNVILGSESLVYFGAGLGSIPTNSMASTANGRLNARQTLDDRLAGDMI